MKKRNQIIAAFLAATMIITPATSIFAKAAKDGGTVILTEVKKTKDPGKTDPTPEKVSATLITLDKKTAGKQQNDTKKAAPKSGDDNEAATYVCLLGLAMVAITAATYRKKRACK